MFGEDTVKLMFGEDKGRSSRKRPCQDDPYSKNSLNIVDSGARYKVYEPIHTSDRLTGHRWLKRVRTRNSPRPLSPDQELLGARADRAMVRCKGGRHDLHAPLDCTRGSHVAHAILLSTALARSSTFGRARGSSCGAVYETALAP